MCVLGAPQAKKMSLCICRDIGQEYFKTDKNQQATDSRTSTNPKQIKYKENHSQAGCHKTAKAKNKRISQKP